MNKKILIGVAIVLVFVIIIVAILWFTRSKSEIVSEELEIEQGIDTMLKIDYSIGTSDEGLQKAARMYYFLETVYGDWREYLLRQDTFKIPGTEITVDGSFTHPHTLALATHVMLKNNPFLNSEDSLVELPNGTIVDAKSVKQHYSRFTFYGGDPVGDSSTEDYPRVSYILDGEGFKEKIDILADIPDMVPKDKNFNLIKE